MKGIKVVRKNVWMVTFLLFCWICHNWTWSCPFWGSMLCIYICRSCALCFYFSGIHSGFSISLELKVSWCGLNYPQNFVMKIWYCCKSINYFCSMFDNSINRAISKYVLIFLLNRSYWKSYEKHCTAHMFIKKFSRGMISGIYLWIDLD